ncbi:hypothetical protein [Streptomyces erythrochromogenes]|uniref:hypothetical protein n=1 Tax=Streptomyces erythrochromogenes TaxID=285574 RepID=UPI003866AD71|nr:hypothetical protein OG489_03885 [Streptomyces erythrochromogenes]
MALSFTTRCLLVALVLLLSTLVGVGGGLLHRRDGATVPAAVFQGGKWFAGAMTVSMGALVALGLLS